VTVSRTYMLLSSLSEYVFDQPRLGDELADHSLSDADEAVSCRRITSAWRPD
jgi:hypothetical protein